MHITKGCTIPSSSLLSMRGLSEVEVHFDDDNG